MLINRISFPGKYRPRADLLERMEQFIVKVADCWIWSGWFATSTKRGVTYVQPFFFDGVKDVNARRLYYQYLTGIDLTGRKLYRDTDICDEELCCNPHHFFIKHNGFKIKVKSIKSKCGESSNMCGIKKT